ncbi:hypothetical protein BZG21_47130, partial [Escherichia coli]|nr:hypothetical protein [Escherichia coli]
SGEGNGFSFTHFNAHDMLHTIRRAEAFYRDKASWKKIVKNAMGGDYSWDASAEQYMDIYRQISQE